MTALDDPGLLTKTQAPASAPDASYRIHGEIDNRIKRLLAATDTHDVIRLQGEVRGLQAALRLIGQKET